MTTRVVITGQGAITALARDAAGTVAAMLDGRCAIGPLDIRDGNRLNNPIGAQITGFDAAKHFTRSEIALFDPATQYAILAADEAMAQAGLTVKAEAATRAGVIVGTGGGGFSTAEDSYRQVFEAQKPRVHPFTVPRMMANAAASQLSMRFGLRGPAYTVATACASSNHAIGQAFHLLRAGGADVMLAGGADAMLTFGGLKGWEGLRVMSPDGCRPFCETRNGMVQGEGAAVFVLETLAHAEARGAMILAEVAGFSMTADAGDIVMPNQDGAARAMAGALADARMSGDEVGYVNAHGTGTAANDRVEVAALRAALGPAAEDLAISSTKSLHGHAMGATGAIEALAVIAALRGQGIAPTANVERIDPECDLDIVTGTRRAANVRAALSNAFAFGGLNAVLAFRTA